MIYLRFRMIILSLWLIIFFGIEQLFGAVDIGLPTYIFILAMVATILASRRMVKVPLWAVLAISVILFLMAKAWMGGLVQSTSIALIIVEICAVVLSILLAYWVNLAIYDFESAVTKITVGRHDRIQQLDEAGQGFIYREVRRARNHQRPLALMAVAVDEASLKQDMNRLVKEVQLSMLKQYMLSGVSKVLCDQVEDCSVIVQASDHFLVAMPETRPEDVNFVIDRLRKQVAEKVGVNLRVGVALLPNDSYTFEGLVDRATEAIKLNPDLQPASDRQGRAVDKPITPVK